MLFRKHIVSTRTLFQLTVALVFSLVGVGVALAANSGNPPLLVPYTIQTVAGTPQYPATGTSVVAGYGGDGGPAVPYLGPGGVVTGATLSAPSAVAVDSVGNIYFTDTNNDIIREVNVQTGVINTIAGVEPKGCSGTTCANHTSGCADGVAAVGAAIGGHVEGIAIDAYGNVYFDDNATSTVSVIYRGGANVAALIALEDPAAAATASAVQIGYVYHIAGAINLSTCAATVNDIDNGLAFTNTASNAAPTATLHSPGNISLDSAGNIYIADVTNATVRVINAQTTPQTFFQYTVQPGYMRSITNCQAALTVACPTITTAQYGTGINGPVNAIVYFSQYVSGQADAYGNIYQVNGTGSGTAAPGIYAAAAYAGGSPLTNLLNADAPQVAALYGPNPSGFTFPTGVPPTQPMLPLTYGNSYVGVGYPPGGTTLPNNYTNVLTDGNSDLVIRASSLLPDTFGTFWYYDNHYPELERVDQYTADATGIIGSAHQRATASITGIETSPASLTNPWYCVYGTSTNPWKSGPQTYDPEGDGCPAILALLGGGRYNTVADGLGSIYMPDGNQIIRELPVGNTFPATTVGTATPVIQAIQVHFDQSNIPIIGPQISSPNVAYTTTSFKVISGGSDFSINTTTPEFAMASVINSGASGYGNSITTTNYQGMQWAGLPTCSQLGLSSPDNSYDCLVYVQFNPTGPGLRQGILQATTANGSVYNFQLTGIGNGGSLAIDGGQQQTVAATGLGTTSQVAVAQQTGTIYIADPTNNRIVVENGGTQSVLAFTGVTPATLNNPMGVAVDAAGNIYISDTGNNRVLEVNAATNIAQVLGNYLWIPGATCDSQTTAAAPCPVNGKFTNNAGQVYTTETLATEPGASVSPTTAPPQYKFNGPEGLAVDAMGNVYVADTGNAAVVEITSNTALGGAVPLLAYPGAPKFVTPVSVAVDSQGNIYVADQGNPAGEIVRIPAGGGDLQPAGANTGSALSIGKVTAFPGSVLFGGQGINIPNGVAVDAAGNVYVSDATGNAIWEAPAVGPPNGNPFVLNFSGLNAPAGLALDGNGNLYVADSGNKQVVFMQRQSPLVSFGTVPQDLSAPAQPLCANTEISDGLNIGTNGSCVLTVSNIGNKAATLTSPFLSGLTNPAFAATSNCTSPLQPGTTCTISTTFSPKSNGPASDAISVNGTQSVALVATDNGTGASPLVKIVLASSVGTAPTAGANAVITATVTQPYVNGVIPTGTVTFTVAIDAGTYQAATTSTGAPNPKSCGATLTATEPLVNGVATYPYPNALAQGLAYTVTANYNGDSQDSPTVSSPLLISVPGIAETVIASSGTFAYGSTVPAITGTLNPVPPAGITYTFTSGASSCSSVGIYPIQVQFSGAAACAYGFPVAQTSSGGAATITETQAPLTVTFPTPFTTVYGAAPFNFFPGMSIAGAVCGDLPKLSATFLPPDTSVLDVIPTAPAVNPYPVIPTLVGKPITANDYAIKITDTTDTVTPAPSGITITASASTALPSQVASVSYQISVSTLVSAGKGVPSGTVTVYDNFVPITPTVFYPAATNVPPAASSSVIPPCSGTVTSNCNPPIVVPLTAGFATFNLPATQPQLASFNQLGTHYLSFQYSGDPAGVGDGKNDFQCSVFGSAAVGSCPTTGTAQTALTVDNPDFTLTSTTGPINVLPGVVPSGNGLPPAPNQSSSYPQTATLAINSVLSFTGNVTTSCQTQNPGYVSCFMTPVIACFATTATSTCPFTSTGTVVLAVSTPATLPLGFNFATGTAQVRSFPTRTVLAFLPFGVLAFCVRRRRRLSKALWVLIAIVAVGAGVSGCGGNLVDFYTPVPTGPQTVTVKATGISGTTTVSRSYVVTININ